MSFTRYFEWYSVGYLQYSSIFSSDIFIVQSNQTCNDMYVVYIKANANQIS